MAGTQYQLQECINTGVIEKLNLLIKEDEQGVKKEAIWALNNGV